MREVIPLIVFTFLMLLAGIVKGGESYGRVHIDAVTRVIDGDTFRANIKQWPPVIGRDIPIRIHGIDTPEIRRPACNREARLAAMARRSVTHSLLNAHTIELRNIQRGSFFRVVAEVWVDGNSVGEQLLKQGLARPYQKGHNHNWCNQEE